MKIIRTLAVYVYLGLVVMLGVPYFKSLEKKKERLGGDAAVMQKIYAYGRKMAQRIVHLTGSKLTIIGAENIPKDCAVLFVANHQSYMDIPVIMSVIEQPIGFVAKEELGKIPFFDQWIVFMKCVLITRGDTRKALAAIIQAAKFLREGHSLVLYPEGTRSVDGTLGEFKAGSLKAAQKGKVGIVPIALKGACDAMPRNSFWMYPAAITATVLPVISSETVQSMETAELANLVKNQIAKALGQTMPSQDGDEIDG